MQRAVYRERRTGKAKRIEDGIQSDMGVRLPSLLQRQCDKR